MKKTIIPILLTIGVSALAAPTDSTQIKRDVTIEKEYQPTIQPAGKVNDIPSVVEAEPKKIPLDYSEYEAKVKVDYQVTQLGSAQLKKPILQSGKNGYLRLGLGTYWSTLGDFGYSLINKPKYKLDLTLDHEGTFGEKMHTDNDGLLKFHRYYQNGELVIGGGYAYEAYNYYGSNSLGDSTTYNIGNKIFKGEDFYSKNMEISEGKLSVGYKSVFSDTRKQNFSAFVDFNTFTPKQGLAARNFDTRIFYENKMSNMQDRFGAKVRMQNLSYNSDKVQFADPQENYTSVFINPYFEFKRERWYAHLGLGAAISGKEKPFAPVCDIYAEANVVNNMIFAYGGVVGNYEVNTMHEMQNLNRWMNLDKKIKDTHTPLDGFFGLRLKPMYNLLADISIHYKTIYDQYFFVNDTVRGYYNSTLAQSNVFAAEYHDADLFTLSTKLNYNFNQVFEVRFGWKHNAWKVSGGEAWQMPKNEFDFGTRLQLGKRLGVDINGYFANGRKAQALDGSEIAMKAIADLNLGITYNHTSKLYTFYKFNNIINSKYDLWNGYRVNGFNVMIGGVLVF